MERSIRTLSERMQDLDRVAGWIWREWQDRTFEQTRAQLLGELNCPATLLALEAGEAVGVLGFARRHAINASWGAPH